MKFNFKQLVFIFGLLSLVNCAAISSEKTPTLVLLDVYEISYDTQFEKTQVGGLSGIDYDKKEDQYYIISDDRAEQNDARIYEAKIEIDQNKIKKVDFLKVIYLKDKNQKLFENSKVNPLKSTDPEDVRYNAKKNTLVWSSEGERIIKGNKEILVNPSIFEINRSGEFKNDFELPANLEMHSTEKGPRRNGVLEGLSFNKNFKKLYTNVEEPLYEDGAQANLEKGGIIRFFEFDTKTLKNTAQYFYPLDPIAKAPIPATGFSVNGVSAILNYKKNKFLVVERSFSVGTAACTIKIFNYDLKKAQKNLDLNSINNTKKLVLNLNTLGIFTDNIEGITFGPKLKSGEQTLLLISDNNFSKEQRTQILLFKIKK